MKQAKTAGHNFQTNFEMKTNWLALKYDAQFEVLNGYLGKGSAIFNTNQIQSIHFMDITDLVNCTAKCFLFALGWKLLKTAIRDGDL